MGVGSQDIRKHRIFLRNLYIFCYILHNNSPFTPNDSPTLLCSLAVNKKHVLYILFLYEKKLSIFYALSYSFVPVVRYFCKVVCCYCTTIHLFHPHSPSHFPFHFSNGITMYTCIISAGFAKIDRCF